MNEQHDAQKELFQAEANLKLLLARFGDTLQATGHIKADLTGLDAVRLYLINKHHWLPREVFSMDSVQMRFALSEEMQDWTLPAALR